MTPEIFEQAATIQKQINENMVLISTQRYLLERMETQKGTEEDPNLIPVQPYSYPISSGIFYIKREYILQAIQDKIDHLIEENIKLTTQFCQL
jgi:type II secretory pathway component PulC